MAIRIVQQNAQTLILRNRLPIVGWLATLLLCLIPAGGLLLMLIWLLKSLSAAHFLVFLYALAVASISLYLGVKDYLWIETYRFDRALQELRFQRRDIRGRTEETYSLDGAKIKVKQNEFCICLENGKLLVLKQLDSATSPEQKQEIADRITFFLVDGEPIDRA